MRYVLTLILFVGCFHIYAQNEKSTLFGLKVGYNRSVVDGVEPDGSKTGFIGNEVYASLFADSKLGEKWNFENELLFSFTDEYAFLEIPLHFKYYFLEKANLFLGPKFDIILNDEDVLTGYNFRTFGGSIDIGAQYELLERFLVEMRYSYGLVEQIDDMFLDIYNGTRNTFRIGIGMQF
jgi:hypothetical protein